MVLENEERRCEGINHDVKKKLRHIKLEKTSLRVMSILF